MPSQSRRLSRLNLGSKRTGGSPIESSPRSTKAGEIVSSDVWGPARTVARGGYHYFSTWTDDHSRFSVVYLQKSKDETLEKFKAYQALLENQMGLKVVVLHSDRGGEYTGKKFDQYLQELGIKRSLTAHDTPQHNGVAERLNYTIANMVRAVLTGSKLPKSLWGYAVMYSVHLKNRLPHKALESVGKTPYEVIYGRKPDLSRIKEFGCRIFVNVNNGDKLDPRGAEARYLGPCGETKDGFLVYWPKKGTVTVERNVRFPDGSAFEGEKEESLEVSSANPSEFGQQKREETVGNSPRTDANIPKTNPTTPTNPNLQESSNTLPDKPINVANDPQDPLEGVEVDLNTGGGLRRSNRIPKPSAIVKRILAGESDSTQLPPGIRTPTAAEDAGKGVKAVGVRGHAKISKILAPPRGPEPRTIEEAKRRSDAQLYLDACKVEHDKLEKLDTWNLVPRSSASNGTLGVKWVWDTKYDGEGNQTEVKARLVVRGDQQEWLVHYDEKFSSVMKPTSRNIILAVAARKNWVVRQGDFKSAYLNGILDPSEEIYVEQPPGFEDPDHPKVDFVCRLKKALYGMVQAGRIWYLTLADYLMNNLSMTRAITDHAVFFRHGDKPIYMGIHVDDPLFTGPDEEAIIEFEGMLNAKFPFKSLGEAKYYLGTTINRDWVAGTISLGQSHYIDAAVVCARLEDASTVSSPLQPNVKIGKEFCPTSSEAEADMRNVPYRELVGILMYIANGTRPDIAYSVNL